MANHNLPTLTSTYVNFRAELDGRLVDLAQGLDPAVTDVTNPPANAIRWSSAANLWQRWNGTSWVSLTATYAISISGNAATAATWQTARTLTIGNTGKSVNGSANVAWSLAEIGAVPNAGGAMTGSIVFQNIAAGPWARGIEGRTQSDGILRAGLGIFGNADSVANAYIGVGASPWNTGNGIRVTTSGITIEGTVTGFTGNISGNASTATTLQTARLIGGVSFDGSANINLPGVNTVGNQNTTGSAATLTTTRTLWGQSFNGSANVSGALTGVGNITGTAGVTLTATGGTLGLAATGANVITASTNGTVRAQIDANGQQSSVVPGGTALLPEFKCRAWVNFNGTGTVAIRASGNVSSITDNGVGNYTVNFTTAMPDANYSITYTLDSDADIVNQFAVDSNPRVLYAQQDLQTAASSRVFTGSNSPSGSLLIDMRAVRLAFFR